MTNTFGLTDYDVYDDEGYDSFKRGRRKMRRQRRKSRRLAKRSKRKIKRASKRKIVRRPPIIKGRPRPRPKPIRRKKVLRKKLPSKVPVSILIPKGNAIKTSGKPVFKPTLIKKRKPIKPLVSKKHISKTKIPPKVNQEAAEKAMKSDSKSGKIIKVLAVVGVTGAVGFGIYKYIQIKKKSNGHTGANKRK